MRSRVHIGRRSSLLTATAVPASPPASTTTRRQQSIEALEVQRQPGAAPRTVLSLRPARPPDDRAQPAPIRRRQRGNATSLLKHIQQFAHKIHLSVADNDKRLKNTEILLSHTAFRLNEMLQQQL